MKCTPTHFVKLRTVPFVINGASIASGASFRKGFSVLRASPRAIVTHARQPTNGSESGGKNPADDVAHTVENGAAAQANRLQTGQMRVYSWRRRICYNRASEPNSGGLMLSTITPSAADWDAFVAASAARPRPCSSRRGAISRAPTAGAPSASRWQTGDQIVAGALLLFRPLPLSPRHDGVSADGRLRHQRRSMVGAVGCRRRLRQTSARRLPEMGAGHLWRPSAAGFRPLRLSTQRPDHPAAAHHPDRHFAATTTRSSPA